MFLVGLLMERNPKRPGPLRLARLTAGLTQSELADPAGDSRNQLVRLETQLVHPHRATVRVLAHALGQDVGQLFPTDDDPAGNGVAEKERAGADPREAY